jgi:hypothetical protein
MSGCDLRVESGPMDDLSARIGTILGGIASGLIPMAIFTPVYAIWAIFAWPTPGIIFFAAAVGWSAYLLVKAIRLISFARPLPHETNAFDARISRGMAIVSSIQGGLILASTILFIVLGVYIWILPTVALIVAVHFFPMPAIFGRTIDYYLGTAMLIVAAIGLFLAAHPDVNWTVTWGVTGIGAALVTSAYGLYIARTANTMLRTYESLPKPSTSDAARAI